MREDAVKFFAPLMFCALLMLPAVSAQAKEAHDAKEPAASIEYIDLNPLSVPVINDNGIVQHVSLSVSLECAAGKRDAVNIFKPRLMDAYLRELYGALGSGRAMMKGNVVNVEELKARLTTVTERVVGPELVTGVLLQSVNQYSMRAR